MGFFMVVVAMETMLLGGFIPAAVSAAAAAVPASKGETVHKPIYGCSVLRRSCCCRLRRLC